MIPMIDLGSIFGAGSDKKADRKSLWFSPKNLLSPLGWVIGKIFESLLIFFLDFFFPTLWDFEIKKNWADMVDVFERCVLDIQK